MRFAGALLAAALCGCRSSPPPISCPEPPPPTLALVLVPPEEDIEVARLRDALERRNWRFALDLVDRIRNRWSLVPTDGAVVDPPTLLIEMLASVPREFLAAYRDRFDARAQRLLARSPRREFWERYFFCTGMDEVGDRIASSLLEQGRPAAALDAWTRLYLYYPDPAIPREVLCARVLMAAAAAGDVETVAGLPGTDGAVLAGPTRCDIESLRRRLLAATAPAEISIASALSLPFIGAWWSGAELPGGLCLAQHTSGLAWRMSLVRGESEMVLFAASVPDKASPINVRTAPAATLTFIVSRHRLVWVSPASPALVGIVELDPLRQIWVGRPLRAPLLGRWRAAVLRVIDQAPPAPEVLPVPVEFP